MKTASFQKTAVGRPLSAGKPMLQRVAPSRRAAKLIARSVEEALVDPTTGEIIARASVVNPVAGNTIKAGKYTWAYRKNSPEKKVEGAPDVLLLHGLGSSSYCYRNTLGLLEKDGIQAYAPDWLGAGDSEKPSPASFDYSEASYLDALTSFVNALEINKPFALVVQGYILGQYGILWALDHPDLVARLALLNTPLARNTPLRPELAAYKNPLPFLRPGNKPFDGAAYAMGGAQYMMESRDAEVYAKPYRDSPAASAAVAATMERCDYQKLLNKVDDGCMSWRAPTVLMFGSGDPFIPIASTFEFLDTKRTSMKVLSTTAKLGHMPQEDYPEAIQENLKRFILGETDKWDSGKQMKMTKKGIVEK